jgi:MFS family permease
VHFTTQFSGVVFTLLWGYPFLVEGQGLTVAAAGTLLSVLILAMLVLGQVYGLLLVHSPATRFPLALGTVVASMVSWAVVLCWPGQAPFPLLVVHVLVLATNMPGSMIGFEYARDANPTHRLGTASGLVNVGGFGASVVTTIAIGAGLELVPGGYRFAFALQFLVYAVGLVAMIRLARTVRRERVTRPTPAETALEQVEALG